MKRRPLFNGRKHDLWGIPVWQKEPLFNREMVTDWSRWWRVEWGEKGKGEMRGERKGTFQWQKTAHQKVMKRRPLFNGRKHPLKNPTPPKGTTFQ